MLEPASRLPSASMRSGSQVLVQSTTVPGFTFGSSACSVTSSTWSVLNTASAMTLQPATPAGDAAALPPSAASLAFFAGSTS